MKKVWCAIALLAIMAMIFGFTSVVIAATGTVPLQMKASTPMTWVLGYPLGMIQPSMTDASSIPLLLIGIQNDIRGPSVQQKAAIGAMKSLTPRGDLVQAQIYRTIGDMAYLDYSAIKQTAIRGAPTLQTKATGGWADNSKLATVKTGQAGIDLAYDVFLKAYVTREQCGQVYDVDVEVRRPPIPAAAYNSYIPKTTIGVSTDARGAPDFTIDVSTSTTFQDVVAQAEIVPIPGNGAIWAATGITSRQPASLLLTRISTASGSTHVRETTKQT